MPDAASSRLDENAQRFIDVTVERFGHIDALVNNAQRTTVTAAPDAFMARGRKVEAHPVESFEWPRSLLKDTDGAFGATDHPTAGIVLVVRRHRIAEDDGVPILIAKAENLGGGEVAPTVPLAQILVDLHANRHCSLIIRGPGENSHGMLRYPWTTATDWYLTTPS